MIDNCTDEWLASSIVAWCYEEERHIAACRWFRFFFVFRITNTVPRLVETVDSVLSLISGEVRGGEGKVEVNCCLVRDEQALKI